MPRYIDADALIKKIFPYDVVDRDRYAINAKAVYEAIQKAPTADVVLNNNGIVSLDTIAYLKKKYTEEEK